LKGKKPRHPESMIALPNGWMKFLSSKGFITFLCLGNEHPDYIGEKGRILGKTYGFDIRGYWEHP
jgi:hypothetical protein